jgi:hypothetical protein
VILGQVKGKMAAFNALGDYALGFFWQSGVEPSCEAIEEDGKQLEPE